MKISDKVVKVLQEEKISPEELHLMLTEAAFTSVRGCNLRYFQWLFVLNGEVLEDMQRVDVVEVGWGNPENRMLEDHDLCSGAGCRECGWVGQVSRAIHDATLSDLS